MDCPTDGTTLLMSERQGIEIDYCPQCRGIWLDRGELDKLLERAKAEFEGMPSSVAPPAETAPPQPIPPQQPPVAPPLPPIAPQQPQQGYAPQPRFGDRPDRRGYDDRGYGDRGYRERGYDDRGYGDRRYDDRRHDPRYRKKKSPFEFLGDIFD